MDISQSGKFACGEKSTFFMSGYKQNAQQKVVTDGQTEVQL